MRDSKTTKITYVRAEIDGGFWLGYQQRLRERIVPYQWRAINDLIPDAPRSYSIRNFRVAAGDIDAPHDGLVFQDSDLAKWLEAAANVVGNGGEGTDRIRGWIEETVDLVARAQQPDGYLNTYFTVKDPSRKWKNLREAHELYCAGHMIEGAVATFRNTGNRRILDVATRLADHIDSTFGTETGKLRGYPGHEEIELALIKLYRVTNEPRYLYLARYFVEERGRAPNFFEQELRAPGFKPIWGIHGLEYFQAHAPVAEQREAVGHAVRAMYLYIAMADLAKELEDGGMRAASRRLWESVVFRKMYITGGIGASASHESFAGDYDLPNDTTYCETCASIGLFVFSHRMALLENDGRYGDVMETALYNGILCGVSLDGEKYFYVNPLSVVPDVCDNNETYRHVKYRRQPWYGCACCPPNVARLIGSIGEYLYHVEEETLFVDHFHTGQLAVRVADADVVVRQKTEYPWRGDIDIEVRPEHEIEFTVAVRIPGWCVAPALRSPDGEADLAVTAERGYAYVKRRWRAGDHLRLDLPMRGERAYADSRVRSDFGKVALRRGPIVYCLEEADNGADLYRVRLPESARIDEIRRSELLGDICELEAAGERVTSGDPEAVAAAGGRTTGSTTADGGGCGTGANRAPGSVGSLYHTDPQPETAAPVRLRFIPYFAWANREPGEMTVWVNGART